MDKKNITFLLITSIIFTSCYTCRTQSSTIQEKNLNQDINEPPTCFESHESSKQISLKPKLKEESLTSLSEKNTILGVGSGDEIYNLALDSDGNVIVTGWTDSSDFPTLNAYDSSRNGISDVFLAKFSSSGELLLSTFLGGSDNEESYDVALDSQNNIILLGYTGSKDFPTVNAYDSSHNSKLLYSDYYDIFLMKFSSTGELIWSTFLGGSQNEVGVSLVVDSQDDVILTGWTCSKDFPTVNAYDSSYNDDGKKRDAVVAKFSSNGSLLWSTYLGGNEADEGKEIVVDSQDNVIVTGETWSLGIFVTKFSPTGSLLWSTSLEGGFYKKGPMAGEYYLKNNIRIDNNNNILIMGQTGAIDFLTFNAFDSTFNGGGDIFVSKIASNGSLLWSTFLGGTGVEWETNIIVDTQNNVIVVGNTGSRDFPTFNAFDSTYNGEYWDTFVSKFSPAGELLWSTLLGGRDSEMVNGGDIDDQDSVLVTGQTYSDDFSTKHAYDSSYNEGLDAFITKFTSTGELVWSTFFGGNHFEEAQGIVSDFQDNVIIIGKTASMDFPLLNAQDAEISGNYDAFISKFSYNCSIVWSSLLGGSDDATAYQTSPLFFDLYSIILTLCVLVIWVHKEI